MKTIEQLIKELESIQPQTQFVFVAYWIAEDFAISDGENERTPTQAQFEQLGNSRAIERELEYLGQEMREQLEAEILPKMFEELESGQK